MADLVGVIGLGNMGGPIARRLLGAGFACAVFDTAPDRMASIVAAGAVACDTPRAVADRCAFIISSLPSPAVSRDVASGPDGVIHGKALTHYIETSTIGLEAAREVAAAIGAAGIAYIDAPISGGPAAIEAYTLTAMVSGPGAALSAVEPVMKAFCKNIFCVGGEPGHAQACKLVNNAMSLSILAVACEATAFGVAAGLDPHVMIDVINLSSGRSAVTETKFPKHILKRRFDFGGALSTGEKDLTLFVDEARKIGALTEITPVAARIWHDAGIATDPSRDGMELVKLFEAPLGVVVGTPE